MASQNRTKIIKILNLASLKRMSVACAPNTPHFCVPRAERLSVIFDMVAN